jgi:hypothetical protein
MTMSKMMYDTLRMLKTMCRSVYDVTCTARIPWYFHLVSSGVGAVDARAAEDAPLTQRYGKLHDMLPDEEIQYGSRAWEESSGEIYSVWHPRSTSGAFFCSSSPLSPSGVSTT